MDLLKVIVYLQIISNGGKFYQAQLHDIVNAHRVCRRK